MDPYRLPGTVIPSRYDLRLEPDLPNASFTGEVTIHIEIREPTAEVLLNAAELAIASAAFTGSHTPALTPTIALDEETERCRLTFAQPLPAGPGRLTLQFTGTLNDKLRGFYRSRFKDSQGQPRLLAATQFEATDARRAFPCWDEPSFKAVFSTTLVIAPGLTALTNTAVAEQREENGRQVIRFADTIPMSTYLVAFVVGPLVGSEPVLVGKTPVRVWCVPGKERLADFGLRAGVFSLRLFEEYYGRKYAGDKLDLIAIPDFAAGAMENFGAITFRETALLLDEAAASHAEKERVADVVCHENAHLWFGDLVTMGWWNGLWLNEAFATFMEMLAVDAFEPSWSRWTTFCVSRAAALSVDGLTSTRPVEFAVEAPRDAEAMFDVLTYEKGASVLRMLEQYLGPTVFQAGVRAYLERHAFGNTETADLWNALSGPAGLPVGEVMHGWVFTPGYPLVHAHLEGNTLHLRQERFRYLADPAAPAQTWQVPVQVRSLSATGAREHRLLLQEATGALSLPVGTEAVVLNAGGHGFYRVRYEPALLGKLLDRAGELLAVERFGLLNDTWAGVLAGLTPLTEYLDLTRRFRTETDRNVWSVLLASLGTLDRVIDPADRPSLRALVRDRLGQRLAALGWDPAPGEDELLGQLRADLLRAAGTLGDDLAVQAEATRRFDAGEVPPALQSAVVPVVAAAGHADRYEQFLERYRSAKTPQEEQRFLNGLAGFRDPALVDRTLTLTLSGEVRTQDSPLLLRALLAAVHSRERAWGFVKDNWEQLERDFPPVGLRRLCEGVTSLARPDWEADVRAFFTNRGIDLGGKTLAQYLEHLHIAVRLREREGEALRGYLWRGV